MEIGVQAIFGPSDPILGTHVQSICDALDIPHMESRIDLTVDAGSDPIAFAREFSINLHPTQPLVNAAFLDLMSFLNWTRVAIVYEHNYGLLQLRELVRTPGLEVHVRHADPSSYTTVLHDIKNKEIHNLIVDTRADHMNEFLQGILQLQMNEYKYHYLFTTFDLESFDLDDFKYNFVNITAFRLVDVEDVGVREVLKDMDRYHAAQQRRQLFGNRTRTIEVSLLLCLFYTFSESWAIIEKKNNFFAFSTSPPKMVKSDFLFGWFCSFAEVRINR